MTLWHRLQCEMLMLHSILWTMEWAKLELMKVSSMPTGTLTSAFVNVHSLLCSVGVLETSGGMQTAIGKVVTSIVGETGPQRTRATLRRSFNELLSTLEEGINNELTHSTALFALFESVDRQFLNLQRTVIRETDAQEREENEILSSLWTRVIGANAGRLKKFEKNKHLLTSLRQKTVRNKYILVDHNHKLLQLKSNLEELRRKLVSPLLHHNNSIMSIEEQIRGLDNTFLHLRGVRERQKDKMMEEMYGLGSRRARLSSGSEGYAIDGSR